MLAINQAKPYYFQSLSIIFLFGYYMTFLKYLFSCFLLFTSISLYAQEGTSEEAIQGYISDELPIFVHSGPSKKFRIVGSVNSGAEIKITGNQKDNYAEIIDDKGRTVWVESKYTTTKAGLRVIIAELNTKLADTENSSNTVLENLTQANNSVNTLTNEKAELSKEISVLNKELNDVKLKLKDQDTNIKKEWFFNGAIVLCIGLILGLIIPRLSSNKKSNMNSWK